MTKNKVHEDCPLTHEALTAIKAELYFVNSTQQAVNPPHESWMRAVEPWREQRRQKKKR